MNTPQLWTLIASDPDGVRPDHIVPPFDCNPGSDEGMLVYMSLEAAQSAAAHQEDTYDTLANVRPIEVEKAVALLLEGHL